MPSPIIPTTMSALIPGYRMTKQIGTGARSRVFIAIEVKSGRKLALKRTIRNSEDDDRFLAQVQTEYAVGHKIDHPHVRRTISLHRIRKFLQTKELLLLMEYVEGATLDKSRPTRLDRYLILFVKVAAGLEAMHAAGYVHADVKPNNIMVGRRGAVKLIDFGQACPIGHRKERIQGTPDYIAPEQVTRGILDERTDVFNLGATMYWVLTSQNFPTNVAGLDGRAGHAVVSSAPPLAPIEINDKIPLALSKLVMDCCRTRPADRPADMRVIRARLDTVRRVWSKRRQVLKMEHLARLAAEEESTSRTSPTTR